MDQGPKVVWDTARVFSQANEKTAKILKEGIQKTVIRRADVIVFDVTKVNVSNSISVRLFGEGDDIFLIERIDSLATSGDLVMRLKDPSGRQAIFVVTKTGITGTIFGDRYNKYSYNIIPIGGGKHLLTELRDLGPPDYPGPKATRLPQNHEIDLEK